MKKKAEPKYITTKKLAEMYGVQSDTVRRAYCVDGNYMGIVPRKMPNGRLLWAVDSRGGL